MRLIDHAQLKEIVSRFPHPSEKSAPEHVAVPIAPTKSETINEPGVDLKFSRKEIKTPRGELKYFWIYTGPVPLIVERHEEKEPKLIIT